MNGFVAGLVYATIIGMIVALFAVGGIVDLFLWLRGEWTMSQWVRENPGWFWVPCVIILAFLVSFYLHLFVLR